MSLEEKIDAFARELKLEEDWLVFADFLEEEGQVAVAQLVRLLIQSPHFASALNSLLRSSYYRACPPAGQIASGMGSSSTFLSMMSGSIAPGQIYCAPAFAMGCGSIQIHGAPTFTTGGANASN